MWNTNGRADERLPRARVSAKPESYKSIIERCHIPGHYMKDPVGQKYLHEYPPLWSLPDRWADIKQVLRTIKQLRKTIIVGVPRATLVICREIIMKQSSEPKQVPLAAAEVVTREYYSSTAVQ
jgi:hypothetical protein